MFIINKNELMKYILSSFALLGFIYIGSIEIFFYNSNEYEYNFIAFFKIIILEYILYSTITAVFVYVISKLNIYVKKTIDIVFLILILFIVINLVFFPVEGLLDGSEWVKFSKEYVYNIIILLLVALFSIYVYKKKNNVLISVSILALIYMGISVGMSVSVSKYEPNNKESNQLLSTSDELLRLSETKNIIYILLDRFDSSTFKEIIEDNDGAYYKDAFKDFIWFNNYASAHPLTTLSGIATFTGKPYDNSEPLAKYRNKVFSSGYSLFEILYKEGWDNILYEEGHKRVFIYAPQLELYSNYGKANFNSAPKYSVYKFISASVYRSLPLFLRNVGYKELSVNNKNGWDFNILTMVKNSDFKLNQKNTFMLFHLYGAHPPFITDENFNITREANLESQAKASLKLVKIFLDKIKQNSKEMYDNSVIVITADHGIERPNALLLIKGINESNEKLIIDSRPLSQIDMKDILYSLQAGEKTTNLKANYNRYFYEHTWANVLENGYLADINKYKLPDNLADYKDNYTLIDMYSSVKQRFSEKSVDLIFPKDYTNLPVGLFFDRWKKDDLGVRPVGRGVTMIRIPFKDYSVKKKVTVEMEFGNEKNKEKIIDFVADIAGRRFVSIKENNYKITLDVGTYLNIYIRDKETILKKLKIKVDEIDK